MKNKKTLNTKNKYTLKYIKRNFLYFIGFIIIVFLYTIVDFLIKHHHISMDAFKTILIITGIFSILAIIIFFISLIYIIRFYKIISMQEKEYNTTFSNDNEMVLSKWGLNYLTDEWFIKAGILAVHYKNIKSLNIKRDFSRKDRYFIIFKTKNDKEYKVSLKNSYHYTKIRKWWNNLKEKDIKKVSDK